jgi:hypothetical protein
MPKPIIITLVREVQALLTYFKGIDRECLTTVPF